MSNPGRSELLLQTGSVIRSDKKKGCIRLDAALSV